MNKRTIWIFLVMLVIAIIVIITKITFSSTISKEQAEKIIIPEGPTNMIEPKPENGEKIKVSSVNDAVTFIMSADDIIYYYKGSFAGSLKKTNFNSVGELIKKTIADSKPANLFFVIKSDEEASFKNSIDLLDEMTTEGVPAGHYAETDITVKENESIKNYKEQ